MPAMKCEGPGVRTSKEAKGCLHLRACLRLCACLFACVRARVSVCMLDKLAINYTVSTLTLLVVYISWLIYIIILDQLRLRHVSTYRGPKAGLPLIRQSKVN